MSKRKPTPIKIQRSFMLLAAALIAMPLAALQITLSSDTVTIGGIAPGGSVALLSVSHEPDNYMMRVVRRYELLLDEDEDGQVQYTPQRGVSFQSIWIAVNVGTGELTMISPAGFVPQEMLDPATTSGKGVEVVANTLDIRKENATLMVVRPGVGAWAATVREGTASDTDTTTDRRIRLGLSTIPSLQNGGPSAPSQLQPGDVVAVLDPDLLQYSTRTVQ